MKEEIVEGAMSEDKRKEARTTFDFDKLVTDEEMKAIGETTDRLMREIRNNPIWEKALEIEYLLDYKYRYNWTYTPNYEGNKINIKGELELV